MTFQIKKIITELTNSQKESDKIPAISNMNIKYEDIKGEKSSKEGFICKNMYIAKIDEKLSEDGFLNHLTFE